MEEHNKEDQPHWWSINENGVYENDNELSVSKEKSNPSSRLWTNHSGSQSYYMTMSCLTGPHTPQRNKALHHDYELTFWFPII